MTTDALFRLPARSVVTVLGELAALRDRARSGEPLEVPTVTMLLAAGHQLTGEVIALTDPTPEDFTVLLKNAGNPLAVTYILGSAIQGVTVHLIPETVHLLSFGKFRSLTDKVPTRLELERYLRSLATQLSPTAPLAHSIAWDEFPSSDAALQQLGDVLQDLQATLLVIQADDLGSTALQEQVQQLEIRTHVRAGVLLQAGALTIQVQIVDHELVALSRSDLQRAIERLL
jgi:hypothetical protein